MEQNWKWQFLYFFKGHLAEHKNAINTHNLS